MAKPAAKVTIYDVETKSFTQIPASELAPGMVQAEIEGREGTVWIDPKQLKQSEFRHPPFEGILQEQILLIQNSFPGIYEKSYEFWEDGFRRDSNPDKEIATWLHIAEVYQRHAHGKAGTVCKEVFSLIITCSTADPENLEYVSESGLLTKEEIQKISSDYFGQ